MPKKPSNNSKKVWEPLNTIRGIFSRPTLGPGFSDLGSASDEKSLALTGRTKGLVSTHFMGNYSMVNGSLTTLGARNNYVLQLPSNRLDYRQLAGNPLDNSAVTSIMMWIATNFTEAPPVVGKRDKSGMFQPQYDHDLTELLDNPNPFYDGKALMGATVFAWFLNGNAYWLKRRDKVTNEVKELYFMPPHKIRPHTPKDGSVLIDYYEYLGHGDPERIEIEDLVVIKELPDPEDPRIGFSRMRALFREIYMDNEATAFASAILKNFGVPGYIIMPKDSDVEIDDDVSDKIKNDFIKNFTADRRGEPMVASAPVTFEKVSLTPEEMDLADLHRLPEERIAAILNIPPMVAGLGAGLAHGTQSNYKEAREMAYESCIIPNQGKIASQISRQLLPDFEEKVKGFRVFFDLKDVRVLQVDENAKFTRWDIAYRGGWAKRAEARKACGLPDNGDEDDVYSTDAEANPLDANPNALAGPVAKPTQAAGGKPTPAGVSKPKPAAGSSPSKPNQPNKPAGHRQSAPRSRSGPNSTDREVRRDAQARQRQPRNRKDNPYEYFDEQGNYLPKPFLNAPDNADYYDWEESEETLDYSEIE